MLEHLSAASLRAAAERAEIQPPMPCTCAKTPLEGWETVPLSLDESLLEDIGTLVADDYSEPSYQEFLPGKTTYWSADAPIAPRYFPYNRCNVAACTRCGRLFLRYTEGGGYFVDRRIRAVRAALVQDEPL